MDFAGEGTGRTQFNNKLEVAWLQRFMVYARTSSPTEQWFRFQMGGKGLQV